VRLYIRLICWAAVQFKLRLSIPSVNDTHDVAGVQAPPRTAVAADTCRRAVTPDLVAVPPVLLGTAYGIWKENQPDKEVWQVIDKAVGASEL
jgi:hypothetical protein